MGYGNPYPANPGYVPIDAPATVWNNPWPWYQTNLPQCDHCFCKEIKEETVVLDAQGDARADDHKQCCMCGAFKHKQFLGGESDNTKTVRTMRD